MYLFRILHLQSARARSRAGQRPKEYMTQIIRVARFLVAAALLLTAPVALSAQGTMSMSADATASQPPLVIFVRHAEKAAAPADDPPLTEAGIARASALVDALGGAGVKAIITTEFKRTKDTAEPLAQKLGITPQVVAARGVAGPAHITAVANAIRQHTSGTIVVVGHSNTVPAIIAALGGERMRDICEADYSGLYVLARVGTATSLVKSRYGADDGSANAPLCAAR
jgi:phosphohistidine phosphatase SixA